MKLTLNIKNRILQLRFFKKPNLPISGYTSRTVDGKHVLFLDYDMVSLDIVKADLLHNLKDRISHAFIFCTFRDHDESGEYGNYHVICIDKFHFAEILDLMKLTHSDTLHKNLAKKTRYRSWVLRYTGKGRRNKPFFVQFYKINEKIKVEHSGAHAKLIKLLHPEIPIEDILKWNMDENHEAIVTMYNTPHEVNSK